MSKLTLGGIDPAVSREIEELRCDPHVKLAQKERMLKNRHKRYLYDLRYLKKRGTELANAGITEEILQQWSDEAYAKIKEAQESEDEQLVYRSKKARRDGDRHRRITNRRRR